MNYLILICVAIVATGANGVVRLADAQKKWAHNNREECAKETGVKPEILAELTKIGNFTDDEGLKKFILCYFERADIVDHDGNLNVATALEKIPAGVDKAEAKEVFENCKNKTGNDAAEKVYNMVICYHQRIKTHIALADLFD